MKFANLLTKQDIAEFITSLNVTVKEIEADLPQNTMFTHLLDNILVKFSTPALSGFYANISDYSFTMNTNPNGNFNKPWRAFVYNKLKQKDTNLANQYKKGFEQLINNQIEELKQQVNDLEK